MRFMLHCVILSAAFAGAAPASADTYKWLDANGVVNYSNAPPPETAAKAKRVGDRISVIAPDPSLGPAIAAMNARAARRAQYEEADWLQRQRYLLSAARPNTPYAAPYYPVAYAPAFVVGVRRFRTTSFFTHR